MGVNDMVSMTGGDGVGPNGVPSSVRDGEGMSGAASMSGGGCAGVDGAVCAGREGGGGIDGAAHMMGKGLGVDGAPSSVGCCGVKRVDVAASMAGGGGAGVITGTLCAGWGRGEGKHSCAAAPVRGRGGAEIRGT